MMNIEHPKGRFDTSRAVWRRAEDLTGPSQDNRPAPTDTDDSVYGDVEVAFVDDLIGLRNSDHPEGPILVFTQKEWEAFIAGAKDGEFDL
jgi:Domain of unknown function (DUF397)